MVLLTIVSLRETKERRSDRSEHEGADVTLLDLFLAAALTSLERKSILPSALTMRYLSQIFSCEEAVRSEDCSDAITRK